MSSSSSSSGIAVLNFGLHPTRSLRVSLHHNISESDAQSISQEAANYSTDGNNDDDRGGEGGREGRFAIMDAQRIVSLSHIGLAANSALSRCARWEADAAEKQKQQQQQQQQEPQGADGDKNNRNRRGIGLETVVCAAGTSHAGYAVRDYGFQPMHNEGGGKSSTTFTVVAIGFDCQSDEEYSAFLSEVGLKPQDTSTSMSMEEYFQRQRSKQELGSLMKAYKISQPEIDMDGSSLEHAVLTRVATKFSV